MACSTPLLNVNTLDLAGTFSDVSIRQIIYNLARVADNTWFVPSQVQLNNGIIAARTNISPSYTTPFGSTIFNTAAIAEAAATTNTSTYEKMKSSPTATLGATAEDTSTWNVSPIQDPEQLKRLQLLYQYGAGKIDASDLLCLYPVPEKGETVKQPADPKVKQPPPPPKKYYIRGEYAGSCKNVSGNRPFDAPRMLTGTNPDIAFMIPPVCILCAYPTKQWENDFKKYCGKVQCHIYVDRNSDVQIKFDPNAQYIPVVLNDQLTPLGPDSCDGGAGGGGPGPDGMFHWKERGDLYVDWLFVDRIGALPEGRTLIGISNGYMVSTTCYRDFSQFVLAIREAELQSPLMEKVGAPAPPVVQTTTGQ
jgi:hypothetical protein